MLQVNQTTNTEGFRRIEELIEGLDPDYKGLIAVDGVDGGSVWATINEHREEGIEAQHVNLFELVSKLKLTVSHYGKGYCVSSFVDFDGTWFANVSGTIHMKGFQANNEPEVILKACNWIIELENSLDK